MPTVQDMVDAMAARVAAAGLTAAELAKAASVRDEVASDLMARRKLPCVSARRRIALLLGTQPEELLVHPESAPLLDVSPSVVADRDSLYDRMQAAEWDQVQAAHREMVDGILGADGSTP